jgi:hypothetical protein
LSGSKTKAPGFAGGYLRFLTKRTQFYGMNSTTWDSQPRHEYIRSRTQIIELASLDERLLAAARALDVPIYQL